jgi:predicted N-acetyltransferase YhbS
MMALVIRIESIADSAAADAALEALLYESYVGGGFTAPEVAATSLRAAAVRARGTVLVAQDEAGAVLGTVTLVDSDSPARRLASAGEREIHLLCVRPDMRCGGVGRALVQEALVRARADGASGVVLWTQPTMHAAQRLYEACGFHRDPGSDFTAGSRPFLVYRLVFDRIMPECDRLLRKGLSRPDSSGRNVFYRYLAGDDVDDITAMLREAYGPLAAAGMRFVASHQDSAIIRRRLDQGDTIVAVDQGCLVGIITLARAGATGEAPFYDAPGVASFGQFAVRPSHQRCGIGRTLVGLVEDRARELGVQHLALDTSEHAADLITFYESLGFHVVARHRWSTVNYESVIMAKDLAESRSHGRP